MAEELLGQVQLFEGEDQQPGQPILSVYFLVHRGLLYHHTEWHGQDIILLVVPCSRVDMVMHLAHSHLLSGHLVS